VWCLVNGRSGEANAAAAEAHIHIQAIQKAARVLRTRLHLQRMIMHCRKSTTTTFSYPLPPVSASLSSIPRYTTWSCAFLVPLHWTLGVVTFLPSLVVEAASLHGDRAAADRTASTVSAVLLQDVSVGPVLYPV